jgi:SAM-dependent methyltransferase
MSQPPQHPDHRGEPIASDQAKLPAASSSKRRPSWRLPAGVAPGTWEYTQQESIANGYRDFIAQTPLIGLDSDLLLKILPTAAAGRSVRVVDFGCGDGRTLRTLWDTGFDVLGVDLSQPMLRRVIAEDNAGELRHKLIRANLVELNCIADAVADHAVCLFSTIGMIRGRKFRRQFLGHAARIVRPGGKLMLHVHNRDSAWRDGPSRRIWIKSAVAAITDRQHEFGDRTYAYRGLADMFLHTYSLRELRADLISSGWQPQEIIPLSVSGGEMLRRGRLMPSLRAGGFIAIATAPGQQLH